eukprot:13567-Rhodomonas_salina.3
MAPAALHHPKIRTKKSHPIMAACCAWEGASRILLAWLTARLGPRPHLLPPQDKSPCRGGSPPRICLQNDSPYQPAPSALKTFSSPQAPACLSREVRSRHHPDHGERELVSPVVGSSVGWSSIQGQGRRAPDRN